MEKRSNYELSQVGVVEVRGTRIGEGSPKIIVPIVETTEEEILKTAAAIKEAAFDIVEWRADWFEGAGDADAVEEVAGRLRKTLGETPILFTFRTKGEGGEKAITPEGYAKLNDRIAATGLVDLIDVELFIGEGLAESIVRDLHEKGAKVIVSNHDFHKTPEKDELVRRMKQMRDIGADIPKIAVMPTSKRDVLTLLSATVEMAESYPDRPIITMSMSREGLISRLSGEVFGSAASFGALGKASAPGQMDARDLREALALIHGSLS